MGSNTGQIFRITTFGESHGPAMGCVIEGCPPSIPIAPNRIQNELNRRRPGQSHLTSNRKEKDEFTILSGVFEGKTLGTPIAILIPSIDARSKDYEKMKHLYRPSHADYTYDAKYGIRDWRGGGRASARETVGRVAAGAIAKQVLHHLCGIEIFAWVDSVGPIHAKVDPKTVKPSDIESSIVRCPEQETAQDMIALIEKVRREKDSIGGIIRCICRNVPPGFGEPVFDKLEADLSKAMMSIPSSKGFEIGTGFHAVSMRGSDHNDAFVNVEGQIQTRTNHSGGIQGGISNGMDVDFRVAFKPVATIFKPQETVDSEGNKQTIAPKGRHDPCVVPRAVPIVEAGAALILCDHMLRQRALRGQFPF